MEREWIWIIIIISRCLYRLTDHLWLQFCNLLHNHIIVKLIMLRNQHNSHFNRFVLGFPSSFSIVMILPSGHRCHMSHTIHSNKNSFISNFFSLHIAIPRHSKNSIFLLFFFFLVIWLIEYAACRFPSTDTITHFIHKIRNTFHNVTSFLSFPEPKHKPIHIRIWLIITQFSMGNRN